MKITYLTLEAPREGQASYVHVHEIIAGFRKQGVDVKLYEPSYTKKIQSPHMILRVFHALYLQLCLWLQWSKGSVLYVRGHYLAYPSAIIAKLLRIPIIHEVNGPYGDVFVSHPDLKPFQNILVHMQRWQYKHATGLIAVTKELQDWVNKEGKRADCVFISNGANVDLFKPDLPKPADLPDHYVIFFGGLARWHGVRVMMRAVNSEKWPEHVKFVIIGDGQGAETVKQNAARNNKIIYLGRQAYKDIPAYISNALAGIVMINNPRQRSSTGVLPLKLFETLACGVPAIVSDLPGQADLIREHECGLVVPPNDDIKLCEAIHFLAKNAQKAKDMGSIGHQIVVKEHSWFARSQETLRFIKSAINQ